MYIATFNTRVKIRDDTSVFSNEYGCKAPGDQIIITGIIENEGKTWLKFQENGKTYYCCAKNGSEVYVSIIERNDDNEGSSGVVMNQNRSKYRAVQKEGCCFLCACYLGGLNNIDEADECYEWAVEEGFVDSIDNPYVSVNKYDLAKKIALYYGRQQRSGEICRQKDHFYVVDNGVEVFNSIRIGYR